MSKTIKIAIYNVEVSSNLIVNDFTEVLIELAKTMDDTGSANRRILNTSYTGLETSIWFDSFDYDFSQENIICFLLAKDIPFQFIEDTKQNKIKKQTTNLEQKPKIPAHCVYLKDKNIILIEQKTESPSISSLKNGIVSYVMRKGDINFNPEYRQNILQRLSQFIERIESIEIIDLKLQNYIKEHINEDVNGDLFSLVTNPNSQLKVKLSIETEENRNIVADLFKRLFTQGNKDLLRDFRIYHRDEKEDKDVLSLYENLLFLKMEQDFDFLEDLSGLTTMDRIDYSKKVYQSIIELYNANNN